MTASKSIVLFFLGLFYPTIFPALQAQVYEDEMPPSLRYLLHSGLDKWEPPKELSAMFPYYLSGFDDENKPIWIVEVGKWDLRAMVDQGEKAEALFDRYADKVLWRLWNSSYLRATPELPVKGGYLIADFDGLDHHQLQSPAAFAYFFKKIRIIAAGLPLVHGLYVINANFIAKNLLNLIRPIVGKDFHRVDIFGTNPNSYRPFLLKILPRDQLPELYGGNRDFKPIQVYG